MTREFSQDYGTSELSEAEQQQLDEKLATLHKSDQTAIDDGVKCLPKQQRDRAKLEWANRWKSEF